MSGATPQPGTGLGRRRALVRAVGLTCVLLGLLLGLAGDLRAAHAADGTEPTADSVVVLDVHGEIDLGLAPFLARTLREAADAGAAAVVLDIDTPGGRLDAVLQMRDALLASQVPTIAFVDRTALSAGALVALASEQIWVTPGAVIGAATPVDGTGVAADEKVVSAVRSVFRSTAEERGRDPRLAEAMVDPSIAIDGVVERGQLVTLTASEALDLGLADGLADDQADLLDQLGLADNPVVQAQITLAERLARLVTSALVSSLLLSIGVLLLIGDLLSGGVGIGAGLGGAFIATFLGGHLIAGLAGWEDVVLVVVGIGLVLLEVFVIPGFGVAGILGLAGILGGAFLAMLSRDFDFVGTDALLRAGGTVGLSLLLIILGLIGLMSYITRRGAPRGLVLGSTLGGEGTVVTERSRRGWLGWFDADAVLASDREDEAPPVPVDPAGTHDAEVAAGTASPHPRPERHLKRADTIPGATGVAITDLRPAGVAEIAGRRVDVVTEGEYLHAGDPVEVLVDEGYRRLVRRVRD